MKTKVPAAKTQIHHVWLQLLTEPSRIEDESLQLTGKGVLNYFW